MKTITGCLAILLGGVGVLVCLALIAGLWWGSGQVTSQLQTVSAQTDQSLVRAEEDLGGLKQQIVVTADAADAARASAAKSGQRLLTLEGREEFEQARGQLVALAQRLDLFREALAPVAQMIENAALLAERSGGATRAERLRSIAGDVREAATELGAVRDRAPRIRDGGRATTGRDLGDFAQKIRLPLDRLTKALSDLKQESATLRQDLPRAQEAVEQWKLTGAGIGTLVLLWVAVGQLAIVAWGRRRLASRNAPVPAAPAK